MGQHNHINMKYFIIVAAFAAVALADHGPVHHAPVHHAPVHHAPVHHEPSYHAPAPVHHEPTYHAPVHHEPSYHAPAPKHHGNSYHEPQYKPSEAHYAYKYGVDAQDPYKGYVNFGAEEARDGYSTKGSYRVLLPDGRTQIVTYYTTDGYSGNVMDVQYEGKASYHEPAPHHAAPHKSHHAPVHHAPPYHA